MTVSKWSATWPTLLPAKTSGSALASSTVSGSSGQPGVSGVSPAAAKTSAQRSQLLGKQPQTVDEDDRLQAGLVGARDLGRLVLGDVWGATKY